ncbi:MAG: N-acetylmuramoyl-L-alanine amidase [Spirochaetales bacterium]|nr:N-acetylmuramoyl-L-alanine amidase [Spirochaetales bacterium]
MPERMFLVTLSTQGTATEESNLNIRLVAIATNRESDYSHYLSRIPYHEAATVNSNTPADCYLQLWELDFYNVASRYLGNEETDLNTRSNRRVVSMAGVVVLENGNFSFRTTERASHFNRITSYEAMSRQFLGKTNLSLIPVGESAAQVYTKTMPEYEGVFELAAVLKTTAENNSFAAYRRAEPFLVNNVYPSARRQIMTRGGFAVSFVADYPNEGEFASQAEQMIATLPTFIMDGSDLKFGRHIITSYEAIDDGIRNVANHLQNEFGLNNTPKASMVGIYCHGIRKKLKINRAGYDSAGSLRSTDNTLSTFVNQIRNLISDDVVIPIFACSAGRSYNADLNPNNPSNYGDNRYGFAYPCEEAGADSLAWKLWQLLIRAGIKNPCIWAHTNAAHTTRNPRLRAFCNSGRADFVNILLENPSVPAATVDSYTGVFAHNSRNQAEALFRERLHNANLLRTISVQHAMYFPWRWFGSETANAKDEYFNADANRQADAVYREIDGLMPAGMATNRDVIVYENWGRKYITGLVTGVTDARLAENFYYHEFNTLANPMRLSVQLLRHVQILRNRLNFGLNPQLIHSNGDGMAVIPSNNTAARRTQTLNKAQEMVDEGLFDSTEMKNNQIYITLLPPALYFAIYYEVPDDAFKRVAENWERQVNLYSHFRSEKDMIFKEGIRSETDFKNVWDSVNDKCIASGFVVREAILLTHASKSSGSGTDGLEFKKSTSDDGTLHVREMVLLDRLPWHQEKGLLLLCGCNTGLMEKRGWSPAQIFAVDQKVKTIGQSGYAYFSQNRNSYVEIMSASTHIHLWAYRRGKNGTFGDGSRMDGIPYHPIAAKFIMDNRIVPRDTWGERLPAYERMDPDDEYDTVVIHHSGDGGEKDPVNIETKHMGESHWDDVGYHFLIKPDGTVYEGRKLYFKGSHVGNANTKKIGILVMGDFNPHGLDLFNDTPTTAQINKVVSLVNKLKIIFPTIIKLGGHRDFTATVCPGDDLYTHLPAIRRRTGLAPP